MKTKKRVKVMVAGAFDVLHLGHLHFLKEAKKRGNYLVVIVATDSMIKKAKGRDPFFSQDERLKLVSSLKVVDKAVLGDKCDIMSRVKEERPQVVVLGYDQRKTEAFLREELDSVGLKKTGLFRASPYKPKKHKSTRIKAFLQKTI